MAKEDTKAISCLVIDTGPIIKNEPSVSTLLGQAELLYTIPSVIDEIRDSVTRSRVETTLLPFLTIRSPKPTSVKVISDFVRRTGDLAVLSQPDIHVIALAYELECERNHGDWRLRSTPGQKELNGQSPASLNDAPGQVGVKEREAVDPQVSSEVAIPPALEVKPAWGSKMPLVAERLPSTAETINEPLQSLNISTSGEESHISEEVQARDHAEASNRSTSEDMPVIEEIQDSESEGSDGEGWITPSNLKKHQAKDVDGPSNPQEAEPEKMQVATITSDFAMQNVLLRMNLNLLSTGLQRIRKLKTWVLRCHACFAITKEMNKQFCDRCGKPTLMRTSCSTDKNGTFRVHLKKNMQWNNRGNVYSIPKPVIGAYDGKLSSRRGNVTWGEGLLLAEDQKEYMRAVAGEKKKKETDLMDQDYVPLSGDRARAGGRPKVGAGRTVNSRKKRR